MHHTKRNLGVGCALVSSILDEFVESKPADIDWVEAAPNLFYFNNAPRPDLFIQSLISAREHIQMSLHFIVLNVLSTDPISKKYVQSIKKYYEWLKPAYISDHLGWRGVDGQGFTQIFPLPFTKKAAQHAIDRIKLFQDAIGQKILIENLALIGTKESSTMPEGEFLSLVCEKAECGLLLDLSNIVVSAHNNKYDPNHFIDQINPELVEQFHIAGYREEGEFLIDSHAAQVSDKSHDLLTYFVSQHGSRSTVLEWEVDFPNFSSIQAEVRKLKSVIALAERKSSRRSA